MSPNVTMLMSTSPHFPAALRSGTLLTPCPQIWALGNLDILTMPLLSFFCATRCPGSVILRTYLSFPFLDFREAPCGFSPDMP